MTLSLLHEHKTSAILLEFAFGSTRIRATTGQSRVTWNGGVYLPDPKILISLPPQSGALDQDFCETTLAKDSVHPGIAALFSELSEPRAAANLEVTIVNLVSSTPENTTVEYLYNGVMEKSTRNPSGKLNRMKLSFMPEFLSKLEETSLGYRCDMTCSHIWGSTGCGIDITRFFDGSSYYPAQSAKVRRASVQCTLLSPHSLRTVSLVLDPVAHPGASQFTITHQPIGWWVRGWLEKDGLRIMIADWRFDTLTGFGTNIFTLSRIPPTSWQGAVVSLVPGCTRTSEACAQRGNSVNFGGFGVGIPAYNPTTEESDE
jgi:hypothetical protein